MGVCVGGRGRGGYVCGCVLHLCLCQCVFVFVIRKIFLVSKDQNEVLSLEKLVLQWLPCQVLGIIYSALGLVGPVSV